MKKVYFLLCLLVCSISINAQLLITTPDFPKETDAGVVITMDASKGNQGLLNYNPDDVYVHIGCITNLSTSSGDWKYVPFGWGTVNPAAKATSLGNNKWSYTLTGANARTYFGITNAAEHILKIAILFRNGIGNQVQRNTDGSDMYVPFYEAGLQTKITRPFRQATYLPIIEPIIKNAGDTILIEAKSSIASNLKLYFNGSQLASTTGTSVNGIANILGGGNQRIIAEAENSGVFKRDTIDFFVNSTIVVEPLPAGVVDGINYGIGGTTATLVLYAPGKVRAMVLGDFNGWQQSAPYQMKKTPDGNRFWLQLSSLTPETEYAYQYLIDDVLKVADYNAEKVLDPNNDQYIPTATYPNLKPYPVGLTTGIVSVLQTAKPQYTWSSTAFTRPNKQNLVVYELLVRDFVAAQNWQTLTDTLTYLKRLGINAIELMPINEFEGNNSWGYNPSFYFAPDKAYGTELALKRFIDSCHSKGMAVIMDIALNHSFGQSPMVQMYFDGANNRPTANSPWFNPVAKHPFNVGYDFNHESQSTKDFVDRVVTHWLTNYRIDGFRWDLSKGFTQINSCTTANCDQNTEVNNWSVYDASRIAIWNRIYAKMQAVSSGSYCILEHFADNAEEKELSTTGMLLWGNSNYNYNEASMGYLGSSNFQYGIFTNRTWTQPNLITYAESHDEERLMFKNEQYGNSNASYNVKDINTGLKRQEMVASFFLPIPGPKMIWQFGELGYDYSINRCENGTIDNSCRLSPKPIVWNYYQNANRKSLYDVYANLIKLRMNPAYAGTFTSNDITWDLSGGFKWMKVNGPALKLMIVGNFDIVPQTASVSFQNAGNWYSYLTGSTIVASGLPQNIILQPGEYYVYTNVNVPLPLSLISFNGKRNTSGIQLNWTTEKEINVKNFELQRSVDGTDFKTIYTATARNTNGSQQVYQYLDNDNIALSTNAPLYYRLKMNDVDDKSSLSKTVLIASAKNELAVLLYPNPVKTNTLSVQLAGNLQGKTELLVQDVSGRTYSRQTVLATSNSNSVSVDVAGLATGMYLLKIVNGSGSTTKPFAVQH